MVPLIPEAPIVFPIPPPMVLSSCAALFVSPPPIVENLPVAALPKPPPTVAANPLLAEFPLFGARVTLLSLSTNRPRV